MEKCRIGADELILWLRKNNKASTIPNDEINGLGQKILKIIEDLGGKKNEENIPSRWAHNDKDEHIGKYDLPKTSAQYLIDFDKLSDLYKELNKL
jgi:hypothetical protein